MKRALILVLVLSACSIDAVETTTTEAVTTTQATTTTTKAVTTITTEPTTTRVTTTTTTTTRPVTNSALSVSIAPENCAGYDRDFYNHHGTSARALGGVGYLTKQDASSGDVDHVVALKEAWCSGMRNPKVGSDPDNLYASVASVNRGKGGNDPLEWWNSGGSTTPRTRDYPGWCKYLRIHVEVKSKYGGSMDQAEYDFVSDQLDGCGSGSVTRVSPTTTKPVVTTTRPVATTIRKTSSGSCVHWHAGNPKHTHPGSNHDGTHGSGKCAGF